MSEISGVVIYSTQEAALILNCSQSYIKQECQRAAKGKKSKFPNSYKKGKTWLIPNTDIQALYE